MTTIKKRFNSFTIKALLKLNETISHGKEVLQNKDGLSHTVEVLVWVLGVLVIAAIVITLAVLLIKNDVFPMISVKVKEIFNIK